MPLALKRLALMGLLILLGLGAYLGSTLIAVAADADGDGYDDSVDADDDNDGISDVAEGTGDADGDGVINSLDSDSDGDGVFDLVEGDDGNQNGKSDIDPALLSPGIIKLTGATDKNGDGWHDSFPGALQDTDGDGTLDYLDADDDGDGWTTAFECPTGTGKCVLTGGVLDYLSGTLFNCDAVLLGNRSATSFSTIEVTVADTNTGALTPLFNASDTIAMARDRATGDVFWGNRNYPHSLYRWSPIGGIALVGAIDPSEDFTGNWTRLAFGSDGKLYGGPPGTDVYEFNTTDATTTLVASGSTSLGTGGDLAQDVDGTWLIASADDAIYRADANFENPVLVTNLSFGPAGIAVLSDGSIFANAGESLYQIIPHKAKGFREVQISSGRATSGDMASCAP